MIMSQQKSSQNVSPTRPHLTVIESNDDERRLYKASARSGALASHYANGNAASEPQPVHQRPRRRLRLVYANRNPELGAVSNIVTPNAKLKDSHTKKQPAASRKTEIAKAKNNHSPAAEEKPAKEKAKGVDEVKSQLTNHWDMDQLPRHEYEKLMRLGKQTNQQYQQVLRQQQMRRFLFVAGIGLSALIAFALLVS